MTDQQEKPKILFYASPELITATKPIRAIIDSEHYQLMLVNANGTSLQDALTQDKYDLAIIVEAPLVHFSNILLMRDRNISQTPILYLDTLFWTDYSKPSRWLWYIDHETSPAVAKALIESILDITHGKILSY